jgi:hypothetical protein
MSRALKPRATAALIIAPATVTDLSAPAVLGLEPRQFRDFLRIARVPHATAGQRVIARIDAVLAAIDRLAESSRGTDGKPDAEDDEPTADAILARIGRRRVPR